MLKREKEIFMRGIAVAFEAMEIWEDGLEVKSVSGKKSTIVPRKKKEERGLNQQPWSDEDIEKLRENKDKKITEISEMFPGRTPTSVRQKRDYMEKKGWVRKRKTKLGSYDGLVNLGQSLD